MSDERRRNYIDRGGEVAWTGPSAFANAKLYVFAVKADGMLVHEMLTRYIARPSQDLGLHVDVRGTTLDQVFFVFLDSERHQRPVRPDLGSEGRQSEQLFAVVVLGHRTHPDPGLVLFAPYVYASDTPGWRAEREIYGYPQQQGRVVIEPNGTGLPERLIVQAHVIKHFAPDAITDDLEILRIERQQGAASPGPVRTVPKGEVAQWIAQSLKVTAVKRRGHGAVTIVPQPGLGVTAADAAFFERSLRGFAESLGPDLDTFDLIEALKSSLPMLFLKQFRDIANSNRACYQAIVEAPFKITGKVTASPLGDYVLDLKELDSAPIRRELGIPRDKVAVDFAFMLALDDLSIDDARVRVVSNPYWNPAAEVSIPNAPSRLPRYVDRGGEAVWRQPSLLFGARIYGFGVPFPVGRQQKLLHEFINSVAKDSKSTYGSQKFRLSPCTGLDMMMLLFVEYDRIVSGTDDDRRLGATAYREFLAMQLALSEDDEFPELDWFIPSIYLDTDSPRLCGREIFGYPKQLGTIDPFERYQGGQGELEPAKTLELFATVIHDTSKNNASRHSVVRVEGPKNGPPTIKRRYLNALEMLQDLLKDVVNDNGIDNALAFGGIGNVFLKQFRDCAHPERACYQAVCKTDTMPGKFHGGGCLDPAGYQITIQNHASEPLFRYIQGAGATGRQATITPVFAYWLDLDFELSCGRVIANPLEADYVPDVSAGVTQRDTSGQPRIVRRTRQLEL